MRPQTVDTHLAAAPVSADACRQDFAPLWAHSTGDPAVCLAVLDGPVDLAHPCFADARLSYVGATKGSSPADRGLAARHGTHVTSIIFGQHQSAVRGVAPRCRGVIDPIFTERSDGSILPCWQLDLARAILRAVGEGANIINISGGQLDATGEAQHHLARAVQLCAENDVLLVASTGNDGCNCLHVPGAIPWVLVVGAMDRAGQPLDFSNWSESYRDHGILAEGQDILGALPGGGTAAYSGTSFATAIVSGVAGLLMSVQHQRTGSIDARAVRRALLESAITCEEQPVADCRRLLSGRLNISGALSHLSEGAKLTMSESHQPVESGPASRVDRYLENGAGDARVERQEATPVVREVPVPSTAAVTEPVRSSPPSTVRETPANTEPEPKSGGSCGCGAKTASLVYALGQIDFDYGTEARRDSFIQAGVRNPGNPRELLGHLQDNPWAATSLIWTLVQETTPIYAVRPIGAFAREAYDRLRDFLRGQLEEGVSQVSIAGAEAGSVTLLNGQEVPIVVPEIRGMFSWSTPALVEAVLGPRPETEDDLEEYDRQAEEIANFLERIYYETGNLGVAPQERAINYAATNAYQVATVYHDAIKQNMKLDRIEVERSAVCRPGSDCRDVKLTFFDPAQRFEKAKEIYRFTIDVSEVVPVTVGKVRRWASY